MASDLVANLDDEAIAALSQEEAKRVAARIDRLLLDPALSAGDRGALLRSRAVASQHFEPLEEGRRYLHESIPLLEEAGDLERHVGALAAAASVDLMLGRTHECMDLAARALLLSGADPERVPANVPANLGVLFNEFSAFDLAFELSLAAYDANGGDTSDGVGLVTAFGLARTVLEAAWQVEAVESPEFRQRLDVARETGQRILDGGLPDDAASPDSQRARVLLGQVILSEAALVIGDLDEAERHIGYALAVPEGSQRLVEGYVHLVAGMVARRRGRFDEARAFFDASEEPLEHEVHRLDRLLAERAKLAADCGDFETAFDYAMELADRATKHTVRCVGAAVGQIRARAEAEHSRQSMAEVTDALKERSRVDSLTGVGARGWFDASLRERSNQDGDLAILILDVDEFKAINDSFSHPVGDAVLRRLGALLLSACAEDDLVARYGGEEFVVVPGEASLLAAHELGERIRKAVESESWWAIRENLTVTVSIGVSCGPASEAAEILGVADAALYAAKDAGRNCVTAQRFRPVGRVVPAPAASSEEATGSVDAVADAETGPEATAEAESDAPEEAKVKAETVEPDDASPAKEFVEAY